MQSGKSRRRVNTECFACLGDHEDQGSTNQDLVIVLKISFFLVIPLSPFLLPGSFSLPLFVQDPPYVYPGGHDSASAKGGAPHTSNGAENGGIRH